MQNAVEISHVEQGREGDWMQLWSGRPSWPADPRHYDVFIEDIANSISKQNRYAGHTKRPYSTAEHSVRIAWLLKREGFSPWIQFQGLMHDAHEAYVIDMPRPAKKSLKDYQALEQKNWVEVAKRFGLPIELDPRVKHWDLTICLEEKRQLMRREPYPWGITGECPKLSWMGWPWWFAAWMFTREFKKLQKQIGRIPKLHSMGPKPV